MIEILDNNFLHSSVNTIYLNLIANEVEKLNELDTSENLNYTISVLNKLSSV